MQMKRDRVRFGSSVENNCSLPSCTSAIVALPDGMIKWLKTSQPRALGATAPALYGTSLAGLYVETVAIGVPTTTLDARLGSCS